MDEIRPPLRWLAQFEQAVPAGVEWLAPREVARLAGLRFPKRSTEYRLRRFVAKHAIAVAYGRSTDNVSLAGIEVGNHASGAPYVLVDGEPADLAISLTDRDGWAVCTLGPAGRGPVGCDLEVVESRSAAFVRDYFTESERAYVAAQRAGGPRDAAANLIWSAKESALKVGGTGLRRDTRSVEVTVAAPDRDGWARLAIRDAETGPLTGWWRRYPAYLLTIVARDTTPAPVALAGSADLAGAVARNAGPGRPGAG
jgi:4'-phosphopantetheinyl transferase